MKELVSIREVEITVFDYESTGTLRGYANEPWQIGMVSLRKGQVAAESLFESLLRVDASRPFNPHAPGRHAVLREEIAAAPTLPELWPVVGPRLTERPLCAHNVATEKMFTRAAAPLHQLGPWIDTLKLARHAWPGCDSYALDDLVVLLDLKPQVEALCPGREAHDALYDAVASAYLLEHLLAQPGWGEVTLEALAGI